MFSINILLTLHYFFSTMFSVDILMSITDTRHTDVFFAVAASSAIDYTGGETIRYDHTYSNVGGGWSATTHHFTCPVSGYYMFTVSMFKSGGSSSYNCGADLYLGGSRQFVVNNYDNTGANVEYTSSGHAILPCTEGQEVYMEMASTSCRLYDDSYHRNQFSGVLLAPGI